MTSIPAPRRSPSPAHDHDARRPLPTLDVPRVLSPDPLDPADTATTPDALAFYRSPPASADPAAQPVPLSARSLAAIPVTKRSVRDIAAHYNSHSSNAHSLPSLLRRDNHRSSSVPADKLVSVVSNSSRSSGASPTATTHTPHHHQPNKLHKPPNNRRKSMEDGKKRLSKILGLPSSPPRTAALDRPTRDWVQLSPTYLFGEVGSPDLPQESVGHGIPRNVGRRGSEGSMRVRPANLDLSAAASPYVPPGPFTADHQRSKSDMSPVNAESGATDPQLRVPAGFTSIKDRRPVTPPANLSFPQMAANHSKNPSADHPRLKAYIKESPQKTSPPLRSSRPRQQLSSYAQKSIDQRDKPAKRVSTLQELSNAVYQGPRAARRYDGEQASAGVPNTPSAASTDGGNTDIEIDPSDDGVVYLTNQTFQKPGSTAAQRSSLSLHTAAGLQQAQAQASHFDGGDSPTLPDDTGTIQIMLGDRSMLSPPTVQQTTQMLRDSPATSPIAAAAFQHGNRQDMSTWSYVSANPSVPGRLTLDSDGYSAIHNIITQYEESGSLSPQLVSALDRHIVADESSMSPKEVVDELARQIDFSRKDSTQSSDGPLSPLTMAFHCSATAAPGAASTASHETDFEDEDSGSEIQDDYNPRPTQARKDSATLTAEDNRLLAESERMRNRESVLVPAGGQPTLPDVPDTGGALDVPESSRISYLPQFPEFVPTDELSPFQPMTTPGSTASYFDYSTMARQEGINAYRDNRRTSSIPSASALSFHSSGQATPTEQEHSVRSQGRDERKLTQRKHVINEIINTEFAYHRDMAVVEDIYMGTMSSCSELTEDDSRVLFANTSSIVSFSRHFADSMKEYCKGVYVRPPKDKRPEYIPPQHKTSEERRPSSVVTTSSTLSIEGTDEELDRGTRIGHVFMEYMNKMEKLYSEYLKNHENANHRLQKLQHSDRVKIWLTECETYVKGLTDAWNLDALLIKPTQRIMKYPMLLGQLLKETPRDHPDFTAIEMARKEVMNMTHRINEAKKRADLLDKVFNPGKPGRERDITKPFANIMKGRTEKFKQNAGITEHFEDPEYLNLVQQFSNSYIQLQVVMKDMTMYKSDGDRFVRQYNSLASAWGSMIDVGASSSPEIESKWRKWAQSVRELILFAWADHIVGIEKYCIKPIQTCIALYDRPQSLIRERKKRLPEYASYASRRDKSEKVDKKTVELAEQFTALNDSLKEELPKLYQLSSKLVSRCQKNWIDIIATWNEVALRKMKTILDDPNAATWQDIIKTFNSDHQYGIEDITSLGICNGSLQNDTSNFLATSAASVQEDGRVRRPRPSFEGTQGWQVTPSIDHSRGSSSNPRPSFDRDRQGSVTPQQRVRSQSGGNLQRPQGVPTGATVAPNGTISFGRTQGAPGPGHAATYDSASSRYYASHPPQGHNHHHHNASAPQPHGRPGQSDSTLVGSSSATSSTATLHGQGAPARSNGVFSSALPNGQSSSSSSMGGDGAAPRLQKSSGSGRARNGESRQKVLWLAASLFDFRLDTVRTEAGYPYLCYDPGEIFDVIGERGELWLARNQDDVNGPIGWIWEKHFAKLINDDA